MCSNTGYFDRSSKADLFKRVHFGRLRHHHSQKGMRRGVVPPTPKSYRPELTWWITSAGQGCHHLPATTTIPLNWVQTKVTTSPGTTPILIVTTSLEFRAKHPLLSSERGTREQASKTECLINQKEARVTRQDPDVTRS